MFMALGLVPLLAVLFVLVKKHDIRHRMKEQLKSHSLQTIILPENEVVWMDDHEIWVHESMFDIRTKKLEQGIYTFTGMYDSEETELVSRQKENSEKNDPDTELLRHLFATLHTLFITPGSDPFDHSIQVVNFLANDRGLALPVHEILTPPPRV